MWKNFDDAHKEGLNPDHLETMEEPNKRNWKGSSRRCGRRCCRRPLSQLSLNVYLVLNIRKLLA